ncbi:MAG: tRNA pseudouridine(38-40) synthase TruA [Clostridia bacterium]
MRIKLIISYLGTNYSGFQLQNNGKTIQGELENALLELYKKPIRITGVGRTDEGVHATYYVAHYDAPSNIDLAKIPLGLNRFLPQDIAVHSAEIVSNTFDARRNAIKKTYVYRFYVSNTRIPALDQTYLQLYKMPNVDLIKQGAEKLLGEHDFLGFAKSSEVKSTVRIIYSLEVVVTQNVIEVFVCGNSFLYNMVRNICGVLLDIGYEKLVLQDIDDMLAQGKRTKYFKTLSPKGLTLIDVVY